MPGFPGFPKEAFAFFQSLAKNNTKEWFEPRKSEFEEMVKAPMAALVGELNTVLSAVSPDHVTEPKHAIYRIYRDTRFSKDKTPYKTHIAANFKHRSLDKHAGAGFYAAVSHESVDFGGGIYMPGPEEITSLRALLADRHEEFTKLAAGRSFRALMGDVQGDQLSRPPKGYAPDHPAIDLLRRKQWFWFVHLPAELAMGPKLLPELKKRCEALAPAVAFLNGPLLARQRREDRNAHFTR